MSNRHDNPENQSDLNKSAKQKQLPEAAKRALAEAEERRKSHQADGKETQKEYGGRGGADPSRFGDWEIDGRAIDF